MLPTRQLVSVPRHQLYSYMYLLPLISCGQSCWQVGQGLQSRVPGPAVLLRAVVHMHSCCQ